MDIWLTAALALRRRHKSAYHRVSAGFSPRLAAACLRHRL
jgi:hypothetical protein